MIDHAVEQEIVMIEFHRFEPVAIEGADHAIDDLVLRAGIGILDEFECVRGKTIIGIDYANKIASCHLDALVHRIIDTAVRLGNDLHLVRHAVAVFSDDIKRAVS